uniref:Uncharacterized protein n=1 Tax=Picea glauca TaxID=3330 RepID=A0A101LZ72_PICGL|nr:hypothetical protein ABT39_MTgene5035 [Picea glauca]
MNQIELKLLGKQPVQKPSCYWPSNCLLLWLISLPRLCYWWF